MILYADIMFVQGFFIDIALLFTQALITGERRSARIAAAAAVGSVENILITFLQPPCAVLFAAVADASVTVIAAENTGRKAFLKRYAVFVSLSVFVSGIYRLFSSQTDTYVNSFGMLYPVGGDFAPVFCAFIGAVCAAVLYAAVLLKRKFCTVRIRCADMQISVRAYRDSGNLLTYNGKKVLIADPRIFARLCAEPKLEIPCRSVSGNDVMYGFTADEVCYTDEGRTEYNAVIACAKDTLSEKGDFSLIING